VSLGLKKLPKRKPRKIRPREKNVPRGYDSKWEYELHRNIFKNWNYHAAYIEYIIKKKYEPDFVKDEIIIEAKGRFWDHAEYSKYVWIRKALPDKTELVFLFQKPYAPMPQAKKRKDGTKRTHAEWAEKNNFRWYSEETLPKEFKK